MKQLIKDMMAEAKHDFKSMHASARPTSKRGSTQIIAEQAKLDTHFWYDLYHDLLTMSDDSVMDEACDDPRTALLLRLRCLLYAKHYEGTEAIQTLPAAIDAYAKLEAARTGVTVPSDADGSDEAVRNPLSAGTARAAADSSTAGGAGASPRAPDKSQAPTLTPSSPDKLSTSVSERVAKLQTARAAAGAHADKTAKSVAAGAGAGAGAAASAQEAKSTTDDLDDNPLGLSRATLSVVRQAAKKHNDDNRERVVVRSRKQSTNRPTFTC